MPEPGTAVPIDIVDIGLGTLVLILGIFIVIVGIIIAGVVYRESREWKKMGDKLQQNPISMGSRFTNCNHPEALSRVLYQIIAMRLEESIQQMERLNAVLPTCTDAEKKATIERELDATLAKLGVKWTHHESAGPAQQEGA